MMKPYVGRFAPTPSGGLHLGSLVTALASYLDAKAVGGKWLIRIDDIDPPREVIGAKQNILQTLENYGFEWDSTVFYQSQRLATYKAIVNRLFNDGLAYACTCSRKELENYPIYTNLCRDALKPCKNAAIRVKVPTLTYHFDDRVQGYFAQQLAEQVGDFVIQRRDGLLAYQLAVVVDDAEQGITHIVRGADLLDSTPRQLYLQELLGFPTPCYLHVPILLDSGGNKLSKSRCSPILSITQANKLLLNALEILGQSPDERLRAECPKQILTWAIQHWDIKRIPQQLSLVVNK